MALIKSFEELDVWKFARQTNKRIYTITSASTFRNDMDLIRQMRRSSLSIVSNIAEGFERASHREFRYFLNIAKASAGELRAQLFVAFDLEYISQSTFDELYKQLIIIAKLINSLRTYLETSLKSNKSVKEPQANYTLIADSEVLTFDSWHN